MMAAAQDLAAKMDVLIRLAALQLITDKTGAEAIALLGRTGMDNDTIAQTVGTTPATVRAALSRARRGGAGSRKATSTSTEGS